MPFQGALTSLLLPPLLLALLALACALLAWRGHRLAGLLGALALALLLFLATPFAAGTLTQRLEAWIPPAAAAPAGAIVVLGGEMASGAAGQDVGPLTLERLRAAAALHRATNLPLLVTAGPVSRGAPPLAELMAESLRRDFGVPVRWVEPAARDTRDNAVLSAAMLRGEGIGGAHVVTHAWHLPRALAAFARDGFPAHPAPVRRQRAPDGIATDWLPRPDHLAQSWFALREWAGLVVYRLRDG